MADKNSILPDVDYARRRHIVQLTGVMVYLHAAPRIELSFIANNTWAVVLCVALPLADADRLL